MLLYFDMPIQDRIQEIIHLYNKAKDNNMPRYKDIYFLESICTNYILITAYIQSILHDDKWKKDDLCHNSITQRSKKFQRFKRFKRGKCIFIYCEGDINKAIKESEFIQKVNQEINNNNKHKENITTKSIANLFSYYIKNNEALTGYDFSAFAMKIQLPSMDLFDLLFPLHEESKQFLEENHIDSIMNNLEDGLGFLLDDIELYKAFLSMLLSKEHLIRIQKNILSYILTDNQVWKEIFLIANEHILFQLDSPQKIF